MKEETEDKGLRKAVKETPRFHLPSNFAYRTMMKVEEAILLHEKKIECRTLWATIIVSFLLAGSCIAGAVFFFGDAIKAFFLQNIMQLTSDTVYLPPLYLLFFVAVPLLLLFDRWMRKKYLKRNL